MNSNPLSGEYGMSSDTLLLEDILREKVAMALGHRMLVWKDEPEASRTLACDWPKGVYGPTFEETEWEVRPTIEHLAFYVSDVIRKTLPREWTLREVVLAETERAWATITDFESVRDFPGPRVTSI